MDHLSFDPDEKVWENVGKKIDEDRKRRRPIFWIFLLTGALVAGSGYFLLCEKPQLAANNPAVARNTKLR